MPPLKKTVFRRIFNCREKFPQKPLSKKKADCTTKCIIEPLILKKKKRPKIYERIKGYTPEW